MFKQAVTEAVAGSTDTVADWAETAAARPETRATAKRILTAVYTVCVEGTEVEELQKMDRAV